MNQQKTWLRGSEQSVRIHEEKHLWKKVARRGRGFEDRGSRGVWAELEDGVDGIPVGPKQDVPPSGFDGV